MYITMYESSCKKYIIKIYNNYTERSTLNYCTIMHHCLLHGMSLLTPPHSSNAQSYLKVFTQKIYNSYFIITTLLTLHFYLNHIMILIIINPVMQGYYPYFKITSDSYNYHSLIL